MEKAIVISHMSDQAWSEQLGSARVEVLKVVQLAIEEFNRRWGEFCGWISQPHVRTGIIAGTGILTFAFIFFGVPALGFGANGILAGSWAAEFQSAVYAGATPAAGWFAASTSAAMTNSVPALAAAGATVATGSAWAAAAAGDWAHQEFKKWF